MCKVDRAKLRVREPNIKEYPSTLILSPTSDLNQDVEAFFKKRWTFGQSELVTLKMFSGDKKRW